MEDLETDLLFDMGNLAYWRGEWDTVLKYYQKALEGYEVSNREKNAANVKGNMAFVYEKQGRYEDAIRLNLELHRNPTKSTKITEP